MTRYECPKCEKTSMARDGKFFRCFSRGCDLHLRITEYLPIAATILKKPLDLNIAHPLSEYKLPDAVANNILKVLYSIEEVKERKKEELLKKEITQSDLRSLDRDNGLTLLLDGI